MISTGTRSKIDDPADSDSGMLFPEVEVKVAQVARLGSLSGHANPPGLVRYDALNAVMPLT